jgi:phosphonate transport system substrate-binding protein
MLKYRIKLFFSKQSIKRYANILSSFFIVVSFVLIAGCKQKAGEIGPKYSQKKDSLEILKLQFAIHPLYNPVKLFRVYQPLINYLNEGLQGEAQISLESSTDYNAYLEKIRKHEIGMLLPNPWQTLIAIKEGYSVIAEAGISADFKGIFIIRKDSDINEPKDLIGKVVCYPSPTALAACIMPQYFLFQHGIDINKDISNSYVTSQESSILNVFLGNATAGATWPPPWRAFQKSHPMEAAELKIIWETESLINNSVMIKNEVAPKIRDRVQELLLGLSKTKSGEILLKEMETECFIKASNEDYNIVRNYINRFEQNVRKVEIK